GLDQKTAIRLRKELQQALGDQRQLRVELKSLAQFGRDLQQSGELGGGLRLQVVIALGADHHLECRGAFFDNSLHRAVKKDGFELLFADIDAVVPFKRDERIPEDLIAVDEGPVSAVIDDGIAVICPENGGMLSTDDFFVADNDMSHVLVPAEDQLAWSKLNDASFEPPFIHLEPRHLGLPSI